MIKGHCHLKFVDTVTRESRELEADNLITDAFYLAALLFASSATSNFYFGNFYTASIQLGLSQRTAVPDRTEYDLLDMGVNWRSAASISANYAQEDTTSTKLVHTEPVIQYTTSFSAPGVGNARDFDTVFVYCTSYNTIGDHVPAYLKLPSTCTQADNEILTLTYSWEPTSQASGDPGYNLASYRNSFVFRNLFTTGSFMDFADYSITPCPIPDATNFPYNYPSQPRLVHDGYTPSRSSALLTQSLYRKRYTVNLSEGDYVGAVIRSLVAGQPSNWPAGAIWTDFNFNNNGPFQGLFAHSGASSSLYLDSLNFAAGAGLITIAGTWDRPHPEIYQIYITASGEVGAATYKIRRRNAYRLSNAHVNQYVNFPYFSPNAIGFDGLHNDLGRTNFRMQRYSNTQVILWDATGISLLNWTNGEYVNYDADSTPALAVTALGQVVTDADITGITVSDYVDGTRILAGCRATGLYEIDPAANTVTQRASDPCYGVDIGFGSKVWAFFDDRFVNSDDYTLTGNQTFDDATFNSDRSVCRFICCNRVGANQEIAIVRSDQNAIDWWSPTDTTPIAGSVLGVNIADDPNKTLECDSDGTFWFGTNQLNSASGVTIESLVFGTATRNAISDDLNLDFMTRMGTAIIDENGSLRNASNAIVGSVGTLPQPAFGYRVTLLPLCPGVAYGLATFSNQSSYSVLYTYGGTAFDNDTAWEQYGWDGSAWVIGEAGSRTVHSTTETLLDSMTIAFTNDAGGNSFVVDDYYTQMMSYGLWKDNATTASFFYDTYMKPVYFNADLGSLTVPASAPYEVTFPASVSADFIQAINDTEQYFTVELDTVETTVLTTGTPVAGEVLIGTDRMTFAAADANKTITGSYAYLSHS